MAGTDLYWGHGEQALRELSEAAGIPVFLNGLARGCLPADHPNFFSRARSAGLKGADLALVIGVPMDFRLGFGGSFGEETEIVQIEAAEPERDAPRELAAALYGGFAATLSALREAAALGRRGAGAHRAVADLAARDGAGEARRRGGGAERRSCAAAPASHLQGARRGAGPRRDRDRRRRRLRLLRRTRDRDLSNRAAGWTPGRSVASAPAPATRSRQRSRGPTSQVCLLLGDGAFGFSGMEFDTMVRHGLPVVAVVGNNGIWGLEKHPMEFVYGYSVAADLRPGTRYDQVVEALGGHGELVEKPAELRPALERAFASGKPACVNVLTDPSVVYPRSANLA